MLRERLGLTAKGKYRCQEMRKQRDWYWQIRKTGGGPNYYFAATFAPDDAQSLSTLVSQHLPSDFVLNKEFFDPDTYQHDLLYENYLDTRTYEKMLDAKKTDEPASTWIYSQIDVIDHKLYIEITFGVDWYDQTNFIIALVTSPDLTLCNWQVAGGGDGYNWVEVAQGSSTDELLDYLQDHTQEAIAILESVPGIKRAHHRDFKNSHAIMRLKDGSIVRTWKNFFGVDHVFVGDINNKIIYGGFVKSIHSEDLNQAIERIRRDWT